MCQRNVCPTSRRRYQAETRRRGNRLGVLMGAASVLVAGCGGSIEGSPEDAGRPVDVRAGQVAYETTCADCHGPAGSGTATGPPLVHRIYEPSHHGDAAFTLAVRRGVPEHHWSFGDMPPQPNVTDGDLVNIVAYVRALQVQAGID